MAVSSRRRQLESIIKKYDSVLVAFSGGVDSSLVLKIARDVLGREHARAVTAKSDSIAQSQLKQAISLASTLDVEHSIVETRELSIEVYQQNSVTRCYTCKSHLYQTLLPLAKKWGLNTILNGTNLDDLGDVRPGLQAALENGIQSPLVEAGCSKQDVRLLSFEVGLEVWNKPASPCLSSRIPYGDRVTSQKLKQIEQGEDDLKALGFRELRLRHFGKRARLEFGPDEWLRLLNVSLREQVTQKITSLGFESVDFDHFRSGRLNEEVKVPQGQFT